MRGFFEGGFVRAADRETQKENLIKDELTDMFCLVLMIGCNIIPT